MNAKFEMENKEYFPGFDPDDCNMLKSYKNYLRENRSFLFDRSFRFVGMPVIGIFVYLVILVTTPIQPETNYSFWPHILGDILMAVVISILVWEGNLKINKIIGKYFDWDTQPRKRLVYQILFNTIYTIIVILGTIILYTEAIGYPLERAMRFIKLIMLIGVIIFLLIDAIYIGYHFFRQWELSRFESEELKRQNLQSQFDALKNQVNPHFLFNSLNALTTLISEDPKLAEEFVQRMASVYRYVLQNKDKELIELEEEVNFIRAFLFLQKIRFGENLSVTIDLPQKFSRYFIAPLTLQMLIENAIKHNIISAEKPLAINICVDENSRLVVRNNLQKKKNISTSTGIGLVNIQQRYELLMKKNIEILSEISHFTVKVPLIKEKSIHENTDY
ncbi:MAG TPA: histidine kinase [Ignavibacteriales bacterium]|nr:histidine kinase [Ignavibacteriales bacterium]